MPTDDGESCSSLEYTHDCDNEVNPPRRIHRDDLLALDAVVDEVTSEEVTRLVDLSVSECAFAVLAAELLWRERFDNASAIRERLGVPRENVGDRASEASPFEVSLRVGELFALFRAEEGDGTDRILRVRRSVVEEVDELIDRERDARLREDERVVRDGERDPRRRELERGSERGRRHRAARGRGRSSFFARGRRRDKDGQVGGERGRFEE